MVCALDQVFPNHKHPRGECKSWTLDSGSLDGLDHGLDYGLEYGLNSRLIFKLLAMVASQDFYRSSVGARNNTGEPTAAAGGSQRQIVLPSA